MPRYLRQTTGILEGLNEDENPHALGDNELTKALNVARVGNMLGTRPGLVRPGSGEDYENQLADAGPIQGIFEYRKDFDEGRQLIAVSESSSGSASASGAGAFRDDSNELDLNTNSVAVTNGQDNIWTFAEHQNRLWAAGGAHTSGGTGDDIWHWDGDTGNAVQVLALTDSGSQRIRPKYITQFGGYLLINGMRGGTVPDNNPAATRYMTFGTDPTLVGSWPTGNTIGFNAAALAGVADYGNQFTTGFANYEDNQGKWLLILGNLSIAAVSLNVVNDFQVSDGIPNGCVSQRAYVSLGLDSGDGIYMSDLGVHSLRQSQQHGVKEDSFLSWKIRTTFDSLNRSRLRFSVGVYDQRNGRVLFAVSRGSDTKHDTILCLDVKDQSRITAQDARWSIWRLVGTPTGFAERLTINELFQARDASGDWHVYAGTNTGDVIRFDEDTFSDLATAYPVEVQTKHRDYGFTGTGKLAGDYYVTLQPGGDYRINSKVVFDYGNKSTANREINMNVGTTGAVVGTGVVGTAVVGSTESTFTKKVYGAGSGETVAFSFSTSAAANPFRIGKVDHQIALLGEDEGTRAT